MAPWTNTLPQPVESRNNERTRRGERRRFTNHLAIKVYRQLSASRACAGSLLACLSKPHREPCYRPVLIGEARWLFTPVELGTGKTDENGQANHEECND